MLHKKFHTQKKMSVSKSGIEHIFCFKLNYLNITTLILEGIEFKNVRPEFLRFLINFMVYVGKRLLHIFFFCGGGVYFPSYG